MIRSTTAWSRCLIALLLPLPLVAQQGPRPRVQGAGGLKPVNGRIYDSLGVFRSVRELPDGRVLVPTDRGDLLVADFTTAKTRTAPGINAGSVNQLFPLGGDTTLVAWTARGAGPGWILLDGTKGVATFSASNPLLTGARYLFGADSSGFVLTVTWPSGEDSGRAVLISRATAAREEVARLCQVRSGNVNLKEQAVLAPDGWIAVLRTGPYRVDWRAPDGKWIRGEPIPVDTIPMDEQQKAAVMLRDAQMMGTAPAPPGDRDNWPAFVEPVTSPNALMATSDGRVVVLRTPNAYDPGNVYDIINRRGELEGEVEINPGNTIVGFGAASVYVRASTDLRDGHLERHPWP